MDGVATKFEICCTLLIDSCGSGLKRPSLAVTFAGPVCENFACREGRHTELHVLPRPHYLPAHSDKLMIRAGRDSPPVETAKRSLLACGRLRSSKELDAVFPDDSKHAE